MVWLGHHRPALSVGRWISLVSIGNLLSWTGVSDATATAMESLSAIDAATRKQCRQQNPWTATELPFLPAGRTPCWHGPQKTSSLRCLPIVYILGFPKCGTTTLFRRMSLHPQLTSSAQKEPHWWTRCHTKWNSGGRCTNSETGHRQLASIGNQSGHSRAVQQKHPTTNFAMAAARYAKKLFSHVPKESLGFEASASTAWDVGPQHCNDTVPQSMHRAYGSVWSPRLRFIVVVRDVVERSWSDYLYFVRRNNKNFKPSQEDFHRKVVRDVKLLQDCIVQHSAEHCAPLQLGELRLSIGLYAPLLRKWFASFESKQFLIVRSEDYFTSPHETLGRVFHFLDVAPPTAASWVDILTTQSGLLARSSHTGASSSPTAARKDTAQLLRSFFAPYVADLDSILAST